MKQLPSLSALSVLAAVCALGCGSRFVASSPGGAGGSVGGTGGVAGTGGGSGGQGGAGGTVITGGGGPGGGVVSPLWFADHETGDTSQWTEDGRGGEFWESWAGEVVVSQARAHEGAYSLVSRLYDASLGGDQSVHWCRWGAAGADLPVEALYSAWYFIPQPYTVSNYWTIMFLGWEQDFQPDIAFAFNVVDVPGGLELHVWDHLAWTEAGDSATLPLSQWFHLEAYYRASSSQTGALVVRLNGAEIIRYEDVETIASGPVRPIWCAENATDGIEPGEARYFLDDAAIMPAHPGSH